MNKYDKSFTDAEKEYLDGQFDGFLFERDLEWGQEFILARIDNHLIAATSVKLLAERLIRMRLDIMSLKIRHLKNEDNRRKLFKDTTFD